MDFTEYFSKRSLYKEPGSGVHYEQKTTPDLIWCIATVVREITAGDTNKIFSDKDVRRSATFDALMQDYFSKAPQAQAENEYNKVSAYQLNLLTFAGVLEQMNTRPKRFKVLEPELLAELAINDLVASKFLCAYTDKFLADNNLAKPFEDYAKRPSQDAYLVAKDAYWAWARTHTKVRGTRPTHTYRVFNKIFNVYAYAHRVPGEDGSRVSAGPCPYSFLIYNRDNFRDVDKPAGMTRQQYHEEVLSQINTEGVTDTAISRAKLAVARYHGDDSVIHDSVWNYAPNQGVHVHHILPKHAFGEFSLVRENLIPLTPGQHFSLAHVRGNTQRINPVFQLVCLSVKLEHIEESLRRGDGFYDLGEFINLLNAGFGLQFAQNATVDDLRAALERLVSALSDPEKKD